jgi:RNA polymerase primary sigma factor
LIKLDRYKSAVFGETNEEPSVDDQAASLNLTVKQLKKMTGATGDMVDLHEPAEAQPHEWVQPETLSDRIIDLSIQSPVDEAIYVNLKETVTRVLASLTPREERVLRMRFGIGLRSDYTLEEVGKQFGVTRERIRQIEAKALRKLKHPTRTRRMRSYLDQ